MPKQLLFATMWGVFERYTIAKLPEIVKKLKSLGYDGIECPIAYAMQYGSGKFVKLLQENDMLYIAQVFTCGPPPTPTVIGVKSEFGIEHPADPVGHDVEGHKATFAAQVDEAVALGPVLRSINSHTGRDYFTPEETDDLFRFCVEKEASAGVEINHETHRARILYSPWVVPRILAAHPALHFTADLSHYSVVAESNPHEPEINKVVAALTPRVRHTHARVGYEEGPQVPDPRTPVWRPYFDGYAAWWAAIYAASAARGASSVTTTPEFGPPHYAWTNPYVANKWYTNEPVVNVWDVNHWVGMQVSKIYADATGDAAGAGRLIEDKEEGKWDL